MTSCNISSETLAYTSSWDFTFSRQYRLKMFSGLWKVWSCMNVSEEPATSVFGEWVHIPVYWIFIKKSLKKVS